MDTYVLKQADIDAMEGLSKQHFLNPNARRINKSLGDLTGLKAIGFHIIEVQAGYETTEFHRHYHEEECVYVLAGTGCAVIGDERVDIGPGDFIGYRAGGLAHTIENTGEDTLRCIVVGQRLDHDVGDYPRKAKRIYRNKGLPWNLVDLDAIDEPVAGKKR